MKKKMKKILFIFTANQYNVVNEMVWRIADYLEQQCRYTVGRCRLEEYEAVAGEWDLFFSAQAIEFSRLKKADGKIHITWLVDHPRYLLERFIHYPELDKVYIGCVDRTHAEYLRDYYSLQHVFFAPHFAWKAGRIIPFKERKYDVFFPASYLNFKQVADRYRGLEGALKIIVDKTISFLSEHREYPLEKGFEQVLLQFGEKDYKELTKSCMELAGEYVDFYLRILIREQVVRAFLQEGITLSVCGRNWDKMPLSEKEKPYLQIIGEELPYTEVIEKMADSKVVLNVMPWFKDGSHERVMMGAMNGAAVFTDNSEYISEIFRNDGVLFYDSGKPEQAAVEIKELLGQAGRLPLTAEQGRAVAEEKGTVENWGNCLSQIISGQKGGYVSIILPTYNRSAKLGKAIESVLNQTYPYFELLIIDDGSTDDTGQVVKEYADERIRYYKLSGNGGAAKARNYGMSLAQYDYIAFEDSDDLWHSDKLEKQMQVIREADETVGMVYHSYRFYEEKQVGAVVPEEDIPRENMSGDIYGVLLKDNMVGMPTMLIKKECLQTVGELDENLKCLEDYDFALRIAKQYHVLFLDEILLDAEYSGMGVSGNIYQFLVASCMILQKYKKDYLETGNFNHRLESILHDAALLGIQEEIVGLLEKLLQL